jgi:ParB family chromosome partitioning protein
VLEARAREANERDGASSRRPATKRSALHPDQEAAATEIADALAGALGIEVIVKPSATGYRAELSFDDPADALALARRLRRPRAVA